MATGKKRHGRGRDRKDEERDSGARFEAEREAGQSPETSNRSRVSAATEGHEATCAQPSGKFRFAIDRGGTFTDVYAELPDGSVRVCKLLSEDPEHYDDAPREGIRRMIESYTGVRQEHGAIDTIQIEWIRMGTTVATNALLERKGERCCLLVSAGLRDLLRIGNQSRPDIFDLQVRRPQPLYERVIEVEERVRVVPSHHVDGGADRAAPQWQRGLTGDWVEVLRAPDLSAARRELEEARRAGITSVAIALMHSYAFPDHERTLGALAESLGFRHVSLSSALTNMKKLVARGQTCVVDAYLTPAIQRYIRTFRAGFGDALAHTQVEFMQSDGGLCPVAEFSGYKAILSGPAGGVVGYARTVYPLTAQLRHDGQPCPVIGFDMGGTSTDVSRYAGRLEHVLECETAGVVIQAPQLDVHTVAAGGGSRLFFRAGLLQVGPESAGANPGPVCYRRQDGQLAVTDANAVLGRVQPEYFPHIFGASERLPIDVEASRAAMERLLTEVHQHYGEEKRMSVEELALGFVRVANEAMCRPIRTITESRGYDPSAHVLACFGGAGGQHACAIAKTLGMRTVFIHRYAGILSAYGIGLSDSVEDVQAPCALCLPDDEAEARRRLDELAAAGERALQRRGIPRERLHHERFLHLRFEGTDVAMMIAEPSDGDYVSAFRREYQREHGFVLSDRRVLVDDMRVRSVGTSGIAGEHVLPPPKRPKSSGAEEHAPQPEPTARARVYFEDGWHERTHVYELSRLQAGDRMDGPALLLDAAGGVTILVEPDCHATLLPDRTVQIQVSPASSRGDAAAATDAVKEPVDPIQLSVFAHRFMGIAEQMGRTFQRTAVSTNIKERLDFSCALFDARGGLVANAPHIPVHLGSMQDAVRQQVALQGNRWRPGDVLLTNHPAVGGTHLPDITVITAVFHGQRQPVFYVASRGHHADVGGLTPGSMPPFSRHLDDEGAAFTSFKIVDDGHFQERGVSEVLRRAGCRCLRDVLSDLRAQVAANQRGITLMESLVAEHGLSTVQRYMVEIQRTSAGFVRTMIRELCAARRTSTHSCELSAEDRMDDGSRICLRVRLDPQHGGAEFDFHGTALQVVANWNAPRSVAASAIIYCLRCLVRQDVPLNQGFLEPVQIRIPSGSLLDPRDGAAVVGGNVLTSQRVTDVVLRAFGACAASQGCMNNLTFGARDMSYYETIGGGSGAGPGWHGESGVQVHMTNTRMTDPEVLELRYPVLLRRFQLRDGSGGAGQWRGGEGVLRELEFLQDDMQVSILSERRVFAPFGMAGGEDGACGENVWIQRAATNGGDGGEASYINLGGKQSVTVKAGDRVRIGTPGGGGYGQAPK